MSFCVIGKQLGAGAFEDLTKLMHCVIIVMEVYDIVAKCRVILFVINGGESVDLVFNGGIIS